MASASSASTAEDGGDAVVVTAVVTAVEGAALDLPAVLDLCRAVGWTACTDHPQVPAAGLAGSSRVVVARTGGWLVGPARVVADGATVAHLPEVLVNPASQGRGDHRLTLRVKSEGLSAEQLARRSVPPSTLSLLGLVRHLVHVEHDWRSWVDGDDASGRLYGAGDAARDGATADPALVRAASTDPEREQAATDAVLAAHQDLGERVAAQRITVRELMVHRVEEHARHCGHADLLRECVDGRTGQ